MLDAIVKTARRLQPGRGRPVAVLRYHRVADLDDDPFGLALPVRTFEGHLEIICRHFTPVALSVFDAIDRAPARAVALTFDDGYRDFATTVRPLLARHQIPATLFVTTDALDHPAGYWWDRIGRICLAAESLPDRLEIPAASGTMIRFDLDRWTRDHPAGTDRHRNWNIRSSHDPTGRHRLLRMLFVALQPLDPGERQRVVGEIERWAGVDSIVPADRRLDADELALLAQDPLIEIGGHSVTHPHFRRLSPDRQWREISDCKNALDRSLGRPTMSFAYPHGAAGGAAPFAQQAGFRRAFTTRAGIAARHHDPFKLPRIHAVMKPEQLREHLENQLGT